LALTELHSISAGAPSPGHQPAFLLIHGLAQNRNAFAAGTLPDALAARGGRVFLGELRGHGLSEDSDTWRLEQYLRQDLPSLMSLAREAANVERVHYIGHSFGGLLGYVMLGVPALAAQLASVTAFAASVGFRGMGKGSDLFSRIVPPVLRRIRARTVRLDWLLAGYARMALGPWVPSRWLRERVMIANPDEADPSTLRALFLEESHAEPMSLFREMSELAERRSDTYLGIDLPSTVLSAPHPIAAVFGSRDPFTTRESLDLIAARKGPRLIIEVPGASHADVLIGRSVSSVVEKLWPFLLAKSATPEANLHHLNR
jgi:pimeloyl-ACP methyl ester carboxylesterase